jgi:type II secretory pathway pseudopilin PulG
MELAMANCSGPHSSQSGFTYIGLMILIALIGIGLGRAGTVWQTEVQREKERELLFIGDQFRQAIGSYYESTTGGLKQYPPSLEDLLHDPRFPETRRHLRKIYSDPVTGDSEWGLIKAQGRIVGVYSKSEARPLLKNFAGEGRQGFSNAARYADWIFEYKIGGNRGAATSVADNSIDVTPPPPIDNISQTVNSSTPEPPPFLFNDECDSQFTVDSATCPGVCVQAGFDICTACWDSANKRKSACKQHGSVPPLITN